MTGRVLALALVTLACGSASAGAPTGVARIAERIEQVTYTSPSFGTAKHFCVVLPERYAPGQSDWPVLYLLHGRGRNDRTLVDDKETCSELLKATFVTVLPNGEDGWYVDSPVHSRNKYAKLLAETIHEAESRYGLSRRPQRRAMAGWSMGGYGCVSYAEAHSNAFALVAPILGLLDFPRHGLPHSQSHSIPAETFGNDEAQWESLNPINSVEQLRTTKVVLITADAAFDRTMNENFRDRLKQANIEHEWIMLRGTHHLDVIKRALPIVFDRVQRAFEIKSVDTLKKYEN